MKQIIENNKSKVAEMMYRNECNTVISNHNFLRRNFQSLILRMYQVLSWSMIQTKCKYLNIYNNYLI